MAGNGLIVTVAVSAAAKKILSIPKSFPANEVELSTIRTSAKVLAPEFQIYVN